MVPEFVKQQKRKHDVQSGFILQYMQKRLTRATK